MPFPSPPWQLQGQAWFSVFWAGPPGRPAGSLLAGFVSYEPGGVLSYSELLVARRVGGSLRRLTITDIWVDSPESRDGGHSLWGIPKELAGFDHDRAGLGPARRADWSASDDTGTIASAQFSDVAALAVRLPFAATLDQPRADGPDQLTGLSGSARTMTCLGHWDFPADGPLGWLAGKQPLASFRVRDFRLTFG